MKGFLSAATVALAGLASAAPTAKPTSTKINLQISSKNATLNNKYIGACHAGAAIESLCIGDAPTTFKFNVTAGSVSPVKGYGPTGVVAFELPVSGQGNVPEPMSLAFDPTSNVAEAIFFPGYDSQQVLFGDNGEMGILAYLSKGQVTPNQGHAHVVKSWYVCNTFYGGYNVHSLVWVVGDGAPYNPTCEKVQVRKIKA